MSKNILTINLKGGAAKTTNASIVSSYLDNATLIEIDKINKSDSRIKSKDYKSIQLDFLNESDNKFLEFENLLLEESTNIIDVGAVKLEVFHKAMTAASLYSQIDLIIITAMDGADDFSVAMSYIETIKHEISSEKIIFSFNRFNEHEYTSHEEQFSSFFEKKEEIKKAFSIDLDDENNYYILKDSRAVKLARKNKVTLKSLVDTDVDVITKEQRACKDRKKRLELTKQRSLILSAQNFYNEYIIDMMTKITKKLEQ